VLESQLRKGLLDLAVIAVLNRVESYGYELNQALAEAGFEGLGDATVYGTLRRIEQSGWVESRLVASSDGPARKYYVLTDSGRRELQEGGKQWAHLVTSMEQLLRSAP
jgi:PadR family transcriptional regulator, regulatory protein PadR